MARLEGGGTETAWFNYSLSALRDEDGSVAAILNITPETTDRVLLERRLNEEQAALAVSEERLRLAVDNADVGLWDVDVVNDRLIWPPRTKAMFGISADVEVSMEDFYNGLHPDDRAATTEAYLSAADPVLRGLYDVEYRALGKEDGIERWVAAKGRGVFDADGKCVRVADTAIDITVRKAAEVRRNALVELTQVLRDLETPADIAFAAAKVLGRALGSSRVGYAAIDHDARHCMSIGTGPLPASNRLQVSSISGTTDPSSTTSNVVSSSRLMTSCGRWDVGRRCGGARCKDILRLCGLTGQLEHAPAAIEPPVLRRQHGVAHAAAVGSAGDVDGTPDAGRRLRNGEVRRPRRQHGQCRVAQTSLEPREAARFVAGLRDELGEPRRRPRDRVALDPFAAAAPIPAMVISAGRWAP
ncbi:PAS domain-containing protein [Sphingomonas nostoxanthinifaciens]|nr:PAS domain-containing protein [Sphingomonas nostoxanthinifaciens]